MAHIYVVTHGNKLEGPNPGMNADGFAQVQQLAPHLPKDPPVVVCGTGKRHHDIAKALGLTPTRWTAVVGDATSLEKIGGKRMIMLPDGTTIPREQYTTPEDLAPATQALVMSLPDGAVICAGRPAMIALDLPGAKNGAVYRLTLHYPHRHQTTGVIAKIEEVAVAGGDVGAGAKEA